MKNGSLTSPAKTRSAILFEPIPNDETHLAPVGCEDFPFLNGGPFRDIIEADIDAIFRRAGRETGHPTALAVADGSDA